MRSMFRLQPVVLAILFAALPALAETKPKVVVTIGDSITDGGAYFVLFRQAVEAAGKEKILWVNAGIGGDTAAGVRARLERDVFRFNPDLVTFTIGTNDALHGVTPEAYESDVASILEQLAAHKIPVIVMTTPILGPKNAAAEKERVDRYVEILERLAKNHGHPIAPANQLMRDARSAGKDVMEVDNVHPNELGHRIMARALLDAAGYKDLSVPDRFEAAELPGIIHHWKLRPVAPAKAKLDEKTVQEVAAMKEGWTDYPLPEKEPTDMWWTEVERPRGVALSLPKIVGKSPAYYGIAQFDAKDAHKAFLNVGANLQAVWLNGKEVYRLAPGPPWRGWHPGKERIEVELQAGANQVVIETGDQFFVSFTDTLVW